MLIKDIRIGMLVKMSSGPYKAESGLAILEGTVGIVTAIRRFDDVYVEFECGRDRVTVPTLCHPIFLEKVI